MRTILQLITINILRLPNQVQGVMFQLRVNPRNITSLLNAVVLVSVPDEFDGANAQVSSGLNKYIDTNWSDVTRILSWRLGELYSGAICEFKALFARKDTDPVRETERPTETEFPVLLRYESKGGLLSDVGIDLRNGTHPCSVKRNFRVYHREV